MTDGSDSNDRRCIRCNSVSVRSRSGTRRTRPYRVLPSLVVPDDCLIPTCARCGADYLDDETVAALGPVLEQAYRDELRRIAAAVIRRLSKWISQRRLELLIGLSQGSLPGTECRARSLFFCLGCSPTVRHRAFGPSRTFGPAS